MHRLMYLRGNSRPKPRGTGYDDVEVHASLPEQPRSEVVMERSEENVREPIALGVDWRVDDSRSIKYDR